MCPSHGISDAIENAIKLSEGLVIADFDGEEVEMGQQRILILREGIRGDGGHDARDIGRAARAAEPLLPHGFDVLKA